MIAFKYIYSIQLCSQLPHNFTSQAFTKGKSYESSCVSNCESQKVTSIILKMGTKVLLKFSFEMFSGRLNLAIVENAHAYCMKIIMFWKVPGRAHCVCFVQKFWLALWSLPIFLIGTLPCTMACTQHVPLYKRSVQIWKMSSMRSNLKHQCVLIVTPT